MNDRIDELLWQAGGFNKISNPNDSFLDGRYILTQEQLDMFAELIVRECAEVVQEGRWMVPPSQEQLARSIKQHFGVEE